LFNCFGFLFSGLCQPGHMIRANQLYIRRCAG
jgi:hypothetical protein